ncbi:MAG: response regulator [Steroidobacteraceae bacterium]
MRNEELPDQVRAMCRLTYLPIAATVPGGLLLAWVMGPTVDALGKVLWVLALGLISIIRLACCYVYLRRERTVEETVPWLWPLLGLTCVSGFIWSFAATLLLPIGVPIREAMTMEVLVGVAAFGFLSLSMVQGAFPLFAGAIMVPAAAWQFYHADGPRPLAGLLFLLFFIVMSLGSMRVVRLTRSQLQVVRENRALSERLRTERDAAFRISDQLRAAGETKSRFLSHVSHELRTPLTVILGYCDVLLRDPRERQNPRALEQIHSAGRFLQGIVNDLLDLSSAEAGRLKVETTDFSLARLLDEIVAELRMHPEARDLVIGRHIAAEVPAWIRSDRGRFHQLFLNLGVNALRFTPSGRVELSLRQVHANGRTLRLRGEVIDTGIGLARDQQARLFQPFTQLGDPAARSAGGVGLGLAICRSIVEQMGGTIGVESAPGAGSTFWFELPVQLAGEHAAGGDGAARAAVRLSGAVLVAEDTAPIRELLVRFLGESGCAPVTAVESGTGLVEAARGGEHDLLLVDRRLPGMDGLDAIRVVRAAERAAGRGRRPIVVVTASVMNEDVSACIEAGADAVVHKPLDMDYLVTLLAQWLAPARRAGRDAVAAGGRLRRALVAEDHAINRDLVRLTLEREGGWQVTAVDNGEQALAACEREPHDLLLLDWKMPIVDGVEVVRRVRERERRGDRPRARIVMVTGRIERADVDTCMAAGADACVAKPYTPEELLAAIAPAAETVPS